MATHEEAWELWFRTAGEISARAERDRGRAIHSRNIMQKYIKSLKAENQRLKAENQRLKAEKETPTEEK